MCKKVLSAVLFLFFTSVATQSYAAVMVGAKSGYFMWRPMIKDTDADWASSAKNGSGILAGPIISLSVTEDVVLTFAGLFGNQNSSWDAHTIDGSDAVDGKYTWDAKRYDIDSAINYTLTPHIKIFAGYKYQYFNVQFQQFEVKYNSSAHLWSYIEKTTYKSPTHGPALGVGFSSALNETYFIAANLSFVYFIQSTIDLKSNRKNINNASVNDSTATENLDFVQYGINLEPSIGAKISQSVIGTVGARVVWTSYKLEDDHQQIKLSKGEVLNDYLYGIFVSVVYMM